MSTVGIIGAGITGPSTALALARHGHEVIVFEQRPENGLHSNGLLGITERNWAALQAHGVSTAREIRNRTYRDYDLGTVQSPFRWMIWTDLHNAIVDAGRAAGVNYVFNRRADVAHLSSDYVIDAGGVVSAARRGLHNYYLGQTLYRGTSPLQTTESFTTYKMPGKVGFLDIGRTFDGRSWWVLGIKRPEPGHHGTRFTAHVPPEIDACPAEFRDVVKATQTIMVLPQYIWSAPATIRDRTGTRFTLGDANGAVRALTTSGANLGIAAGMMSPMLVGGDECTMDLTCAVLLKRRAFALDLGIRLRGPEIGGVMEDPNFDLTQFQLYGARGDVR